MTIDEFTADLDRYIKLGWPSGNRPALLFAATAAEKITANGSPEVGPGYEFVIDGYAYVWNGYDGWDSPHRRYQAEQLLNLAAEKWMEARGEIDALVAAKVAVGHGPPA